MLDYHGKQIIGILLGIASMLLPAILAVNSIMIGDVVGIFFGVGLGFILAIIGLIFSSIGLKQAKDRGGSKAKGVIGLLLSIGGIVYFVRLVLVFGGAMLMALNSSGAASFLFI
ncbi:MAG: hypothetical protein K5643_02490 [Saccharofermentans sp.]|nr:hypothetical protein [Saccharofermentans sp.]